MVLGTRNSAVGTLVERSTRFVLLLHLTGDDRPRSVQATMIAKIGQLPAQLGSSLGRGPGKGTASRARFEVEIGGRISFCDPGSPWQPGANENTNGLLRQYLPKGTNLSVYGPDDLDGIASQLNGRPRMTLDWDTPGERLERLLVAATAAGAAAPAPAR